MGKRLVSQISRWVEIATHLQNCDDIEAKHKGICNLLQTIDEEWGDTLEPCLTEVKKTSKGERLKFVTYPSEIDNELTWKCIDILQDHLREVELFEGEDDAQVEERLLKLYEYRHESWVDVVPPDFPDFYDLHSDNIYCKYGLYRRYWELKDTEEYKILRALQLCKGSDDDLLDLYKVLLLYVSLQNEQTAVAELARIMDIELQTIPPKALRLHQNGLKSSRGTIIPPEENKALDVKVQEFLGYMPTNKSNEKAVALLQRVIDEKYCDDSYKWNADLWGGRHVLALSYFAFKASQYLELKTFTYASNSKKDDGRKEKNATLWKPFEELFEYDGKKPDKNGGYHQLQRTKTNWKQKLGLLEFEPPKDIAERIDAFFESLPS